jgi:hypothetical protein
MISAKALGVENSGYLLEIVVVKTRILSGTNAMLLPLSFVP